MPPSIGAAKKTTSPDTGEQTFHLLFEDHPIPMWIYDLETLAFLAVNDAAVHHYGYTRPEFLALTLKDIRPAEDVPRLLEDVAQARPPWQQSGGWRHRRKDGTVIDVEITSHTIEYQGHKAALVTAQDITERRRAEAELRYSREQLRLFVEQAPTAIAMFDHDMNYVAASRRWLMEYSLGQRNIIGQSHYDIFPEIPERWKEVHRRALSGEVIWAEEDRFERLDGSVQWLHWEVRPWLRSDGAIGGIIIFTEDITGRKQAEEKIARQNERLNILHEIDKAILAADTVENIVAVALKHIRKLIHCRRASVLLFDWATNELQIFDVQMNGETSLPPGSRLPLAPFPDLIETLLQHQPILIDDSRLLTDPGPLSQILSKEGLYSTCILPLFSDDSLIGTFNLSSEIPLFFDEEKVGLGREIANQVAIAIGQSRLVETLHASEEKYRTFFQSSLDAILLTSPDGSILAANAAACKMLGRTEAEICALGRGGLLDTNDPRLEILLAERARTGQVYGELTMFRNDGSPFPVEVSSALFQDRQGNIHTSMIIRDITERKLTEAMLRKLNRTLAVLSDINHAIIRLHNLPRLFAEACRIAVEVGGFRMAWLGQVNPVSGQVEVVAQAGVINGYLEKLNIRLNDAERSRGPTGQALSTGQHVVCNDIQRDPRMALWRAEAMQLGYLASAAFPLSVNGEPRGTFNLYATETGFFDEEELKLLDELAQDLSFAMQFSEQEEKRRRAEEELRQAQERLQRAVSASNVGLWEWDLPTNQVYYSPEWKRQIGYGDQEISSNFSEWESRVHPDDLERAKATIKSYVEQPWPNYSDEFRFRHKDGSYRWILVHASLEVDEHGQPQRMLGSHIDITTRKQAEEQLLYQANLLQNVSDAIIATDREFRITSWNRAAEIIYGWSAEEMIGKRLSDVISTEYLEKRFETTREQLLQEGHWRGEVIQPAKDGSKRYIFSSVTLLHDQSEQPAGAVAVNRDITAQKQLEAQNEQLTAQFYQAQKMESIGRLAGGIAHDFNNLLVPIVGYTELDMLKLAPDSPLYTDLKRIKEAGQRAASLTRQILAFSRQQVLEMKLLDLNLVVSEFEPMLRRLIGEDINLQMRLAADLPALKADKGQLEQVLLNLVVNARDAMSDGGILTLETGQVVLDQAYVTRHAEAQPGPHAILAVSDTGHGMDAITQEHIFEPFFTTKAQGKGTGLGLATVFGIVKQHGGNIWVYSELGYGTTFKVYLPLAEAAASIAEAEPPPLSLLEGMETVLIVEDEASVRQLVCDALQASGYQILATGDPAEGLALAAAHPDTIHLLLTDVIMPRINGRDLYRQLIIERPELKVLYMSGYTDDVIAHHHILDEGIGFLQKPFSIHDLLQKVRVVLG